MRKRTETQGMISRGRGLLGRGHARCRHVVCVLAALAIFASASVRAEESCRAPAQAMLSIELIFGRSVEGRLVVADRDWARFLAREVTPRFSEGLSVVDAAGQYKTLHGRVAHEPSKLVVVVAPDKSETHEHIAAIQAAYKKEFRQQTVVAVTRPVCASF
jgi:hypothetical protein